MRRKKQYASRNEGYARDSYDDELANGFTEEEFFATISKDESALTYAPFQNEAFKKIEEGSAEMAQGDHGAYVVLTRNVLNDLDHTVDTDSQLFDEALTKEVASYQEKKGLKVTQTINAETVRALDKEAAAKQSGDDELTIAKRAKMLYLAFEHKSFLFFGGTDEKAVYRALSGITPKQKYELIEYYNAHYKSKRGKDLVRDLQHEMGGAELFKAINLLFTDYSPEESKTENYSFEGLDFQFQLPAVTVTAKRSWIKPKTKFTLLGGTIHFDCGYTPLRPVVRSEGERVQGPSVRRIFVTHNKYTDEILAPTDDIKNDYDFDLGHKTFHWFSMKAKKPGPYLFTFVIRELDGTDSLHRVEHNVKVIANENSDRLKDNIPSSYLSYRYNVAKTEFQLQKNTVKDQKGIDSKFYIETASYTENPAEMGYADVNAVPHLYYSVKGANVDTSKKYLWFAEINQEAQEMKNLVDIYSKDVKLHGYQREEYDGKDGFKLKETGTEARFLRTIPGEFTIYCMQLDDNGNAVKQVAAYRQVVLPPEQYKVLAKYKSFKKDIDESFKKLDEKTAIPVNAVGTNLETTKTIPINLYLGKSTTNPSEYVLTDLTPGVQHQRDFTGSSIEEVFSELDEKNTYPRGMVSYSIPTNEHGYPTLKGLFYTDGMSMWDKISSEAGWASLGLAVAGVVASFTPAAPLAPFLFAAASAAGVTTGVASMVDKTQKGTITAKTATLDTLVIASSLLGMGGALSKAMVRGKSVIKLTETGYKYVILQELKLSAASALMISYDGIKELAAINENENLSTADRIDYTIKTLAQLVIVNGLLALSAKSLENVNANQELEITIYDAPEGQTTKAGQYKPKQDIEDIEFEEVLLSGETVRVQAQRNLPAVNGSQKSSGTGGQTIQGGANAQKELPVSERSSQKLLPANLDKGASKAVTPANPASSKNLNSGQTSNKAIAYSSNLDKKLKKYPELEKKVNNLDDKLRKEFFEDFATASDDVLIRLDEENLITSWEKNVRSSNPDELAEAINRGKLRDEYVEKVGNLKHVNDELAKQGKSPKEIAVYVVGERRRLTIEYKHMTPEDFLEWIFKRNEIVYVKSGKGDKWGATFDGLFESTKKKLNRKNGKMPSDDEVYNAMAGGSNKNAGSKQKGKGKETKPGKEMSNKEKLGKSFYDLFEQKLEDGIITKKEFGELEKVLKKYRMM